MLLGCTVLLAIGQALVGPPRQALPDLVVLGLSALMPMAIAVRVVQAPGAASAICGAYLLPRALLSLAQPNLELPPLLLVPALAFDLVLSRQISAASATAAGAMFGLALALVEPPFAVFIGGDPALWQGTSIWTAAALTVAACAVLGRLSARDTGAPRRGSPRRAPPA